MAAGRSRRRWTPGLCALTGGLLTGAAFPDLSWWPAAIVGVALLRAALRGRSVRAAAVVGLLWGSAMFLPQLVWAYEAAGPAAWLAVALLEAALVAVGTAAWTLTQSVSRLRRGAFAAMTFVVIWVADEQLRSSWPFGGLPWGRLAFSQADGPLLRLAWLGGAPLVSAAVALLGYLLEAAARALAIRRSATLAAGLAAAVVVVPVVAATIPLSGTHESGTLRVGAVQGDVPRVATTDSAFQVLENHVSGTRRLLEAIPKGSVDVVLWPENATDVDPRSDARAGQEVEAAAQAAGVPILLGTDDLASNGRYIQMLLWAPDQGPTDVYSKQRIVPFGEYIPLRAVIRLFSREVDRVTTDAVPGTAPAVMTLDVRRLGRIVTVATPICFEVAFDDVVRNAVRDGAELIVVPTNNASFGRTAESTQQLAMSRLRAVEHGRGTVQISTVGVSAVISPDGSVQQRTQLFTAASLEAELPLRHGLSPSDRLGSAPGAVTVTAALLLMAAGAVARSRAGQPRQIFVTPSSDVDSTAGVRPDDGIRADEPVV